MRSAPPCDAPRVPRLFTHLIPPREAPPDLRGAAAVAIDVLRASTTLTAALAAGARSVLAVGELDEARALAAEGEVRPLLAGERNCLAPEGFDLGNSPLEMTAQRVRGRELVATTSNGTRALLWGAGAERLLLAGFVNLEASARRLARASGDVHLVCAGADGRPTLDDVACAGALARRLFELRPDLEPDDGTQIALAAAPRDAAALLTLLLESGPGRRLVRLGMDADVRFAAQRDGLPLAVRGRAEPQAARRDRAAIAAVRLQLDR